MTHYEPLRVDARAASRGVRTRLFAAAMSCALALAGGAALLFVALDTFSFFFALTLTLLGAVMACAFVLSARREELVHQLASAMHRPPERQLSDDPDDATDGWLRPPAP